MLETDRTTTADRQRTDSAKLTSLLRGDLDWIVLKALEKDRTRRYATASALTLDIGRYLNNEPVLACPPKRCLSLSQTRAPEPAAVRGRESALLPPRL
jgi:hypothetical protein